MPATTTATAKDRDERTPLMEPMRIGEDSRHRSGLLDLAIELAQKSAGFNRSLPASLVVSIADLVRSMNCYYSNLIEGHDTHPIDIERALRKDYSADPKKRDLQLEAQAHIGVQWWIDGGGLTGRTLTVEGIREIHQRFYTLLPDSLANSVKPGELRQRDVQVGALVAVSPGAVPRFLARFEAAYKNMGKADGILAMAAAHHRLLWIHPFLDGNGRVARLMSHAMALELLDTGGIWSVARGLARNSNEYKALLANCDLTRRNDLDGRGTLSEEALAAFTRFFLKVSIDQVNFMESLLQPERLRARILLWVEEEARLGNLPLKSGRILEAILYRGELPRGDAAELIGTGDRQVRRVVSDLMARGVVVSDSPRSGLRMAFPATLASRWMPGLFPDQP